MNARALAAIVRKDLMVVGRSRGVILPIILVPLIMLVILPAVAAIVPQFVDDASFAEFDMLLEAMPVGIQDQLMELTDPQRLVILLLVYFMAPMYLIVPLMVASVIAADSFAGEKERKTLEALLYTPTTDRELLTAKLLSAWIPALAVAWGGFVLYAFVGNAAAWPVMGRLFFPNWMWIVLVIWVVPAVAGLGLLITVLISARVRGFQEAYQLSGVVVLPVLLLVIGQATGVMVMSTGIVALLGLVLWIVDLWLLRHGARTFRRGELIARL